MTKCPLCNDFLIHLDFRNTHIYACSAGACPFIGFEFYTKEDLQNLIKRLKNK